MSTRVFVLTVVVLLVGGCKTRSPECKGRVLTADPSTPSSVADTQDLSPELKDAYAEGFTVKADNPGVCSAPDKPVAESDWPFEVRDDSGTTVGEQGLGLDSGQHGTYTVFTWPKAGEIIDRDYNRLGELMTEYSKLVGTCLDCEPQGAGEIDWLKAGWFSKSKREAAAVRELQAVKLGSDAWCKTIVREMVDKFVRKGSSFLQYGNCGEGARVGVCLAKRAGFNDQELSFCYNRRHVFALVKRGVENGVDYQDCLLDRWDKGLGHFKCNVQWSEENGALLHQGKRVDHSWYNPKLERIPGLRVPDDPVSCITVAKYFELEGARLRKGLKPGYGF